MRLVMTLLVRDEADIVGECVRHHLASGVDFVIATDHGSVDGTSDILRSFEREGRLLVIRETGDLRQAEWVTRMASLAAAEHGADWVLNVDADEFWWSRKGTLREVLEAVPQPFGAVRALLRHFAPRPSELEPFYERMIARQPSDPDPRALFHAQVKVAHRARVDVAVTRGNHDADGDGLRLIRQWFPFEVLHFPVRTAAQMQVKFRRRTDAPAPFVRTMRAEIAAHGVEAVFERLAVADSQLASDATRGGLAVDVRLRDALRGSAPSSATDLPAGARPESPAEADEAFIADIAAFMETDSVTVLEHRLEALEGRIGASTRRGLTPRASLRRLVAAALPSSR